MIKTIFALAAFGLLHAAIFAGNLAVLSTGLNVSINPNGTLTLAPSGDFSGGTASFNFLNGKTNQAVKWTNTTLNNDTITFTSPLCEWRLKLSIQGKVLLMESHIVNNTSEELWPELGVVVTINSGSKFTHVWQGKNYPVKIDNAPIVQTGILGDSIPLIGGAMMLYPMVSAYGDQAGLNLGHVLYDPVSYSASSYTPGSQPQLKYVIRQVVPGNGTIDGRLILGLSNSAYGGKESAVQLTYDSFPEIWKVAVGQDHPKAWGALAHYYSTRNKIDLEFLRRFYITWDWWYGVYQRGGDMWITDELYNYKPIVPSRIENSYLELGYMQPRAPFFSKDQAKKITAPMVREMRKKAYQEYGKDAGWAFYNSVSGTWCEIQLANEKYPDAIVHDPNTNYQIMDSWQLPHDRDVRVFPMGTSFAQSHRADTIKLINDMGLNALAMDCSCAGAFYRGPAIKQNLPGKAWDKDGVFIDQYVAINDYVDFVRQIQADSVLPRERIMIAANGLLKADIFMTEAEFLDLDKFSNFYPMIRYMIGQRPVVTHGYGFNLDKVIPDWKERKPEEFMVFFPKLVDYITFAAFKWGATPDIVESQGVGQLVYMYPELMELRRLGWQAEFPVKFDSDGKVFETARYSSGVNTVLFIGNPYDVDFTKKLEISNNELGNLNYLFVRKLRRCAETANQITGSSTTLNETISSRIPILYEAVAGIVRTIDGKFTVKSQKALNSEIFTIAFVEGHAGKTPLTFRTRRDFKLDKVTLDGRNVDFKLENAEYTTDIVELKAGSEIVAAYESAVFHNNTGELLNFGFTNNDKQVNFAIVIPKAAGKAEEKAAKKLQSYFNFARNASIINHKSALPEIVSEAKPGQNQVVITTLASEVEGITLKNANTIIIAAHDPFSLAKYVEQLSYLLDERYPYLIVLNPAMGLETHVLDHFGVRGKAIPFKRFFD
ncbi:MAG: hypothetical protein WCV67_13090 [Victivallaceae bacterium]|jgi:hypothetical protein